MGVDTATSLDIDTSIVVDNTLAATLSSSNVDEPGRDRAAIVAESQPAAAVEHQDFDAQRTVTLPPNQSLWKSTLNDRTVIVSVNEGGLLVGDGTPYEKFSASGGTFIWAETLVFTSSISSPPGLTVAAHTIVSQPGQRLALSTAGENGKQETAGEAETTRHGKSAGPLNVYLERGTDQHASNLLYLASGGAGGYVTTAGARGGDGGHGGKVVRIFRSVYHDLFLAFAKFLAREDVTSGSQDAPVDRSTALYSEAYALLDISTSGMSSEVLAVVKAFRDILEEIGKKQSRTLRQLIVAARRVRNALVEGTDKQSAHSFVSSVQFDGGFPGSGHNVLGITGTKGNLGSSTALLLPKHDNLNIPLDSNTSLKQMPFAFAHPRQCAMLLTRANTFYYMGSGALRARAIEMYQRLVDRLSFLEVPLVPTDPLYKAYETDPIMPTDSLKTLQAVRNDASAKLAQLMTGRDFNSLDPGWVPRASYPFYKDALDGGLENLAACEAAYIAYHAAQDKQEELQDAVNAAVAEIDAVNASIATDRKELEAQLQKLDLKIASLTEPVRVKHFTLLEQYEKLKSKIKNAFEFSVPQLVNALTTFAFAPNKGMGGIQAVHLAYQGYTSVPDLDGNPIPKERIIGKLNRAEVSVKGIKSALSKDKLDGTFELDDPFGTRLLATEDEMMAFLEEYSTSSFAEVIDEMKAKFDDYAEAIIERNKAVLDYNIVLKLIVERHAKAQENADRRQKLTGRLIKLDDPDLPEIADYIESLYNTSRASVMKQLNFVVRSLNFRMLQEHDIFSIAFGAGSNTDTVPLSMTSVVLQSARGRVQEKFGQLIERWGKEPSKFPLTFDHSPGKIVELDEFQVKTLIAEPFKVDVEIPPVYKESPKGEFSGCCNVRIYKARFGFTGLKLRENVKSARVAVRMTHHGEETLVDQRNLEHTYTHDEIAVIYSFKLFDDGTIQLQDDGNIALADVNQPATSYAPPGPFTTWTVDVSETDETKVDFSGVTAAWFDFCGTNHAMP